MIPQVGQLVEVVVDNSFVHGYLSASSKHRAKPRKTVRGMVIGAPSWLKGPHVCLLNSETKTLNYIPEHRIVSINDNLIPIHKPVLDRVYSVTSSKTDEVYTIRLNGITRVWSCTCTGWQFNRKCKHTVKCELEAERIH